MKSPTDAIQSPQSLHLHTIHRSLSLSLHTYDSRFFELFIQFTPQFSRITELMDLCRISNDDSELLSSDRDQLLKDFTLNLQSRTRSIVSEFLDSRSFADEDFDEYLKENLNSMEAENEKVSNEIEILARSCKEDANQLASFEGFKYSSQYIESQRLEKVNGVGEEMSMIHANGDCNLELLELSYQSEKNKVVLKSLQDLEAVLKRFEAIEKIEDALAGLKVLEVDRNCIQLSLWTEIPNLNGLVSQQNEDIIEPCVLNHELLIEVVDGTMELKSVEIFPNDAYIGEIIGDKSIRKFFSSETRSSLAHFVSKVRDRIILCTLRRFLVKGANKSRHSFEYLDRDEMIVAHMVGGVDAYIKVGHGWPISNSALKLISLKSSDQHSKGISLSFLCKVEVVANSMGLSIRQNISSFVDAIEETLIQQMRSELHSDDISRKSLA